MTGIYPVSGMTGEVCSRSVTKVEVDLTAGRVSVSGGPG